MKAARFYAANEALRIEDIDDPVPAAGGVVVRVQGAGVCHSDLHITQGEVPLPRTPLVLGHENAGVVERVGPGVEGFAPGDPVAVFGAWGCGYCALCRAGDENLCNMLGWPGIGVDGGWAELISVPALRHLIPLGDLDPVEAAPLTDAGLTPYRAIRRALPFVPPGGILAIIGLGGLGHLAVQIARAIGPSPYVIAVDVSKEKLENALALGADEAVEAGPEAGERIRTLTGGEGAHAVVDLVGSDASLATAGAAVARGGIVVLVGIAGGALPFRFVGLPPECHLTTSAWGTRAELEALLGLAERGLVRAHVERQPLDAVNDVLERLAAGRVEGRVVLTPGARASREP